MPGTDLVHATEPERITLQACWTNLGRLTSCKDASHLISQLQDGKLPLRQWMRVRLHLMWCEACKRFEQQLGLLREAMRRYEE